MNGKVDVVSDLNAIDEVLNNVLHRRMADENIIYDVKIIDIMNGHSDTAE